MSVGYNPGQEISTVPLGNFSNRSAKPGEWRYYSFRLNGEEIAQGGFYIQQGDVVELAGSLVPKWRQKRLAQAVARKLVEHAVQDGGGRRILAAATTRDKSLETVLRNLGFKIEYRSTRWQKSQRRFVSYLTFVLDNADELYGSPPAALRA